MHKRTESEMRNKEAHRAKKNTIRNKVLFPNNPDSQESLLHLDGTPSCGPMMSPKFVNNSKKKDKSLILVDQNQDLLVKNGKN